MSNMKNPFIKVFHGSDHVVEHPTYLGGKEDNDYGNGFYTTEYEDRAVSWAALNGNPSSSVVNIYRLDLRNLNIKQEDYHARKEAGRFLSGRMKEILLEGYEVPGVTRGTVSVMRKYHIPDEEIVKEIQEEYNLTRKEAEEYL